MLYAMFAMVALTFIIGFITVKVRVGSIKHGNVSIKYYKLMTNEGGKVPDIIAQTSRCFSNQFEMPVLFYVVVILFLQFNVINVVAVIAAWLFVAARCIQAYVHLTYNNVLHRASAFWLSCLCVLVLWVDLAILVA